MLLVDTGHGNSFTTEEVSALLSRVADRGYDVEFNRFGVPQLLEEKLRKADSLAVIVPARPYSEEEVDVIGRFVKKGGKLLLIADPTRRNEINSLAERFGIAFQADYLYNTKEYDINFQNIFIRDFVPDELTDGLSQIALYTAGSIRSSEPHLAYTDANTRSNIVERIETFYPIVKRRDGRVLAISDLTFMIPPQNSILDNDRLGLQHSRLPHGERERVRAYRLPPPWWQTSTFSVTTSISCWAGLPCST